MLKNIKTTLIACLIGLSLTACFESKKEDAADAVEAAGEQIEETVDAAAEAMDDAAEEVKEEVEDAM